MRLNAWLKSLIVIVLFISGPVAWSQNHADIEVRFEEMLDELDSRFRILSTAIYTGFRIQEQTGKSFTDGLILT